MENIKFTWIHLGLKQNQVSFGQQEQAKHLYTGSVHTLKTWILGVTPRDAGQDTEAEGVWARLWRTVRPDMDTGGHNYGQKSDGLVTEYSCSLSRCAEGPMVDVSGRMQIWSLFIP